MAFFDNLSRKLTQAGQGALQKTKDIADVARLNSAIADEEKVLNNNYYQIGKLYAQLHSADCEECFSAYIAGINESLKKIEDLKVELQAVKAIAKCPNCGAEVPNTSAFCNACGTAMPNPAGNAYDPDKYAKCPKCNSFVEKEMNFCTQCGSPMAKTQPAPAVQEAAVAVAAAPVVSAPVVEEPVVNTPVVEAPVVETPVVEAPVIETPVTAEPAYGVNIPMTPTPVAVSAEPKCPNCGALYDEDSIFCVECGTRLR